MRKEVIKGTGNGQRTPGGGRLGGGGREGESSVRFAWRFPRWKAAGLQTRTILLGLLLALDLGTCALPMGLEGLNPLRKTAERLIPGADLLYYFREPVTGARPLAEFEAPGYTGTVVWQPEDGSLTRGFAAGTVYTAVVTLSADTDGGFAFNVPAAPEPGSFSHSRSADGGAGVKHDAGTGATLVITVKFD
ncbi:MAG: hypothetical protein LBK63_02405, partial [Treponema sp.]|nr:hypothetical protein [Treponema sp.]